jgi:Fic family protein
MLISESSSKRGELTDLALELASKSTGLKRSLQHNIAASLADLVRSMNCYYSNLIEGHDTHPIDIERALKEDYSADAKKRDLQIEAKAHISVQKWIDGGGVKGRVFTSDTIRESHQRFCELLPGWTVVANPSLARRTINGHRHQPGCYGAVEGAQPG